MVGHPLPWPWVQGGPKGGPVGFWSLSGAFWQKLHLNHPGKCRVTQWENLYKIGPNKFMSGGRVCGRVCVLFGMHFSQSKNACLLNWRVVTFSEYTDQSSCNKVDTCGIRIQFFWWEMWWCHWKIIRLIGLKFHWNKCAILFYKLIPVINFY